jgi:hypothetical protein
VAHATPAQLASAHWLVRSLRIFQQQPGTHGDTPSFAALPVAVGSTAGVAGAAVLVVLLVRFLRNRGLCCTRRVRLSDAIKSNTLLTLSETSEAGAAGADGTDGGGRVSWREPGCVASLRSRTAACAAWTAAKVRAYSHSGW